MGDSLSISAKASRDWGRFRILRFHALMLKNQGFR
jgi:hypothetical protein